MVSQRMRCIILVVLLIVSGISGSAQQTGEANSISPDLRSALASIRDDKLLAHVNKLASDEFEGRGTGTRGDKLTVNYLTKNFKRSGLKPGNPNGTFVQKVLMVGFFAQPKIDLDLNGEKLSLRFLEDFIHENPALLPSVTKRNAGVVFAGYGIVAPEYGWDDYKGADVRNKLVIVLSGEPTAPDKMDASKPDPTFFKGSTRTYYSTRKCKYDLAISRGAAAILLITDPEKAPTFSLFRTFAKLEGFAIQPRIPTPAFAMTGLFTTEAAAMVARGSGSDLQKLMESAESTAFRPVPLNASANISINTKLRKVVSHNVVARVEGSDPSLKNEYVIYSAHWDHLGTDTKLKGDQIYNGAIDNAVGTAQLLEVAEGFAKLAKKPKRSILFIATTAEEKGYLGSRYYVENPLYPIDDTVANINLDGGNVWGKTTDVISSGYGLSSVDEYLDDAARSLGRNFVQESIDNNGLYFSSDQIEFAKAGIPAVFPFSGFDYIGRDKDFGSKKWEDYADKNYHQVSDEVRTDWDLSGAAENAQWLLIAGYNIAQSLRRPEWKAGSEFKPIRTK